MAFPAQASMYFLRLSLRGTLRVEAARNTMAWQRRAQEGKAGQRQGNRHGVMVSLVGRPNMFLKVEHIPLYVVCIVLCFDSLRL